MAGFLGPKDTKTRTPGLKYGHISLSFGVCIKETWPRNKDT